MLDTAISARPDVTDKALVRSFSYVDGRWVGGEVEWFYDAPGVLRVFAGQGEFAVFGADADGLEE